MSSEGEMVTARKWGHSIGITLSKKLVEKEKIRPEDKLIITVKKAGSLKELFGSHKFKKSTQEIKDELKKGWE